MSSQEFPNQEDYAKCSFALKKKGRQTINKIFTASPNFIPSIKP